MVQREIKKDMNLNMGEGKLDIGVRKRVNLDHTKTRKTVRELQ